MPAKHTVKLFIEGGYYHIFNRGVEKRPIFLDDFDYRFFILLLKRYLDPSGHFANDPNSLLYQVELLAFCLMSNHFHILIKQKNKYGITNFMRTLCSTYVNYFNGKYQRVGPLFQSKYKAVLIKDESQLLQVSKYIHLNPASIADPKTYNYSSYKYYLNPKPACWLNTQEILQYFSSAQAINLNNSLLSYQSFVENQDEILRDIDLEYE